MSLKPAAIKNTYRKVQPTELAEGIDQIIGTFRQNKVGIVPKMAVYRRLLEQHIFLRSQLSQTSFYRMVREHDLLNSEKNKQMRLS